MSVPQVPQFGHPIHTIQRQQGFVSTDRCNQSNQPDRSSARSNSASCAAHQEQWFSAENALRCSAIRSRKPQRICCHRQFRMAQTTMSWRGIVGKIEIIGTCNTSTLSQLDRLRPYNADSSSLIKPLYVLGR